MHSFEYHHGELYCEQVPVSRIAKELGTPCYIYSYETLVRHFHAYDNAFKNIPHLIAFAMKANSNLAILRLMAREGSGVDIVSGGELFRALKAGVPASKIVFAGVGKTAGEIRDALNADILMFNVESTAELHAINQVAVEVGRKARIALRINPDIDPKTHPYISTGLKKSKFGIAAERAVEDFVLAASMSHIEVVGVHAHIGSQLTDVTPFTAALKKVVSLIETLNERGLNIRYLNIGGGLGITYSDEKPPLPQDLSNAILPLVQGLQITLVMEPGRVIVGNAGILVTKAMYLKEGETKSFVIVDAAMNDLIRPSLYEAYHEVRPVNGEAGRRAKQTVDIVGPVCESGDFLAKDRSLPAIKPGELLAVMSAGAYGFVMASNYNSRPRVPEVLVRDGEFHVIRERERHEDLIKGENIPSFLNAWE